MEFLDISLTKDLSILFHAIQSFLLADLKKTTLFSDIKNPYKKIRETRKLPSVMNSILKNGKRG
jgi:hypothetical protein